MYVFVWFFLWFFFLLFVFALDLFVVSVGFWCCFAGFMFVSLFFCFVLFEGVGYYFFVLCLLILSFFEVDCSGC